MSTYISPLTYSWKRLHIEDITYAKFIPVWHLLMLPDECSMEAYCIDLIFSSNAHNDLVYQLKYWASLPYMNGSEDMLSIENVNIVTFMGWISTYDDDDLRSYYPFHCFVPLGRFHCDRSASLRLVDIDRSDWLPMTNVHNFQDIQPICGSKPQNSLQPISAQYTQWIKYL